MTILMRLSPLILVALLQTGTTEKGWTDLFNGTDFSGWKTDHDAYTTAFDRLLKDLRAENAALA